MSNTYFRDYLKSLLLKNFYNYYEIFAKYKKTLKHLHQFLQTLNLIGNKKIYFKFLS